MQAPIMAEITQKAGANDITDKEMKKVLAYLVDNKRAYFIDGNYIHAAVVDTCRQKINAALDQTPAGLTVAQFRDLTQGNRKICLLLLQIYDNEGVTRREGDLRVRGNKRP
jgi:selenocysteine-specific elongation factor